MDKLAALRREYRMMALQENDLLANPIAQFEVWLQQAIDAGLPDPTAMTVATVSADGQPSQRIVLLKDVSDGGLVFYTNLGSRKAKELASNNKVSLHFPWHALERQVKICGTAQRLTAMEVARYFATRPKQSQIAAWASEQSQPIASRQLLMGKFAEMKAKFAKGEVPLPSFWGGYRVLPHEIEFWQGGEHRLHNRFVYQYDVQQQWQIQRLMP